MLNVSEVFLKFGRKGRAALVAAAFGVAATGCTTPGSTGPVIARPAPETPTPVEAPEEIRPDNNAEDFITQDQMGNGEPVRVALLLPFSNKSKNVEKVATAMSNAAQLAAFDAADQRYLLIPKDTGGTAEGAAAMANEAIAEGAEIILGPLFSDSVNAAAAVSRQAGVPMIAFSSDMSIAGNGVYLLSFPPEMEVARVTDYAMQNNYIRFGLIAPATEYGSRISNAFAEEVFVRGGIVVHEERYEQSPDAMLQPAKRLARYAARSNGSRAAPISVSPSVDGTPRLIDDGQGFQAVLMPEQGTLLRALAPLLPYYDVDVKRIKLLGVSAWNNPRLTREPALNGGWFAAPEPELSEGFKNRYKKNFGEQPPRLASLAYDASLLAARLAKQPSNNRFTSSNLSDPSGYLGADGLFRLTPSGRVERGLAILEIRSSGIKVIDPAPRSFVDFSNDIGSGEGY